MPLLTEITFSAGPPSGIRVSQKFSKQGLRYLPDWGNPSAGDKEQL
ncbi:MAG: hypothetical protein P0116_08465 [Candidatus Nitrosocosmicus sp.]|nr:hypothetical protein [Candidatus Nitrosocosmicus sp.]